MAGQHSTARSDPDAGRGLAAIILAAGRGTRMPGDLPKVLQQVAGRPMVRWVVDAVRAAGAAPIVLVVGVGEGQLREAFAGQRDVLFVRQEHPRGTGHATACARQALGSLRGDVLVLAGDGPLIRPRTIEAMLRLHRRAKAAATLATAEVDDPTGYGRIVRDAAGRFEAIVEHAAATGRQRAIREVYPSYACFDAALLFEALQRLEPHPVSGELQITDVPALLRDAGHGVELLDGLPPEETLSINTPKQLREVDAILTARVEQRV